MTSMFSAIYPYSVAFLVCDSLFKIFFITIFWKCRGDRYIEARQPELVVILNAADLIFSSGLVLEAIIEKDDNSIFPCLANALLSSTFAPVAVVSVLLRGYILYVKYVAEGDNLTFKIRPYLRRKLWSRWFGGGVFSWLFCLCVVLAYFDFDADELGVTMRNGKQNCYFLGVWYVHFFVSNIIMVPLLFIGYKLWSVDDNFNIKTELASMGCFVSLFTVALLYNTLIFFDVGNIRKLELEVLPVNFIFFVITWGVFFVSVVHPVYVNRTRERQCQVVDTVQQSKPSDWSMAQIIADEAAWALFKEHARKALCIESVLFVEAVDKYRDETATPIDTRAEAASVILCTYIRDNSDLEVNVNASMKRKIESALTPSFIPRVSIKGNNAPAANTVTVRPAELVGAPVVTASPPPLEVFDDAKQEIIRLLQVNLFNNFVHTPIWMEHVKQNGEGPDVFQTPSSSSSRRSGGAPVAAAAAGTVAPITIRKKFQAYVHRARVQHIENTHNTRSKEVEQSSSIVRILPPLQVSLSVAEVAPTS